MSDPNWFYSTLAQSTAAIVGLSGAFMVQRVLTQRNEAASQRFDLRASLQSFYRDIASEADSAGRIVQSVTQVVESPPVRPFQMMLPQPSVGAGGAWTVDVQPDKLTVELVRNLANVRDAMAAYRKAFPSTFAEFVAQLERHGAISSKDQGSWLDVPPWQHRAKPEGNAEGHVPRFGVGAGRTERL
jgi:hypothetical protein